MATIGTAFKKIYGEALAPYGFRKIKGKQPYLARMIGDEIVQVITFRNETSLRGGYKAFDILCGVATVYRGEITLDCSPRDNLDWLNNNGYLYGRLHRYDYNSDFAETINPFYYMADDEESLYEALKLSLEISKQIILPELKKVTDLVSCLGFFRLFSPNLLHIYVDENFGRRWSGWESSEGLLNMKLYSANQFSAIVKAEQEEWNEFWSYRVKMGKLNSEACKRLIDDGEKGVLKQIESFELLANEPEQYSRVLNELEIRRENNQKLLLQYGIIE